MTERTNKETNERTYSAVEAAKEVGKSDTWVRNQIKQGSIAAKRDGRLYVIPESELPTLRQLAESNEPPANERTASERTNEEIEDDFGANDPPNEQDDSLARSLRNKVARLENEQRLLQDVIDRQNWVLAQEARKHGEEVAMLRSELTQLEAQLALPNPERTNEGWFRSFVRRVLAN